MATRRELMVKSNVFRKMIANLVYYLTGSVELAPGVMQYEVPHELAQKILQEAKSLTNWNKSSVLNVNTEQEIRTSCDLNFEASFDKELVANMKDLVDLALDNYMGKYSHCSIKTKEGIGVLKYVKGGWYDTHVDASWQVYRTLSMLVYLNPKEYVGGETWFPKFNLKIKPKTPAIVFFPSNYIYAHQAMPIKGGEKFVLVSWMSDLPLDSGLNAQSMEDFYQKNKSANET
jgi:hypothetical protein